MSRPRKEVVDLCAGVDLLKLLRHRDPQFLFADMGLEFITNVLNVGHDRFGSAETFDDDPRGSDVDQSRDFSLLKPEGFVF